MAERPGRNDPCPCGSGKKYKRCCLIATDQSALVPWPVFPEDIVLAELVRRSKEFVAFYEAERRKIAGEVHWARDVSLPVGIDYRTSRLQTGAQVIRLRRIPAVLEDAVKIAHELEHLVLDTEGFPCTGALAQHETLSSALNSMIHDPIVNSRLKLYGFDLQADHEREVQEALRQLASCPRSPGDRLGRMHWCFNYAGQILEWEIARGTADGAEGRFQAWFDARYPDIAREGQQLLALVRNIGYDTPEKQTVLFREIIRKYELSEWVCL
jgi:hypothetical protein